MTNFYEKRIEETSLENLVEISQEKESTELASVGGAIVPIRLENENLPEVSDLASKDLFKLDGNFSTKVMQLFNSFTTHSSFLRTYSILSDLVNLSKNSDNDFEIKWEMSSLDDLKEQAKNYLSFMSENHCLRNFDTGDSVKTIFKPQNSLKYRPGWACGNAVEKYERERNTAFPIGSLGTIINFEGRDANLRLHGLKSFKWSDYSSSPIPLKAVKENYAIYTPDELEFIPITPIHKKFFDAKVEEFCLSMFSSTPNVYKIFQEYHGFKGWENTVKIIPRSITDVLNPTKEEILEFSKLLHQSSSLVSDFTSYNTSNYLTALMHSSNDNEFEIDLTRLNGKVKLSELCYRLKNKKLKIIGDVGDKLGYEADNSIIIVEGNAGTRVGYEATGCEIYIRGNYESLANKTYMGSNTKIFRSEGDLWKQDYPKEKGKGTNTGPR